MTVDTEAIRGAVEPALTRLDLDLYDVRFTGSGRSRVLQVLVDRAGGIDLDAIADVSRVVSRVLDEGDLVLGTYVLEVSSPGLERPLRTPAHFARAVGETVSVKDRSQGETRRIRGTLTAADDSGIVVDVDGCATNLRYDEIGQARTVFDWEAGLRREPRGDAAAHKVQS
jgi:ribosome maturation factor RimP